MFAGRLLVVAFEGWNDAGEAASGAVRMLKEQLDVYPIAEIDAERFFDYQFNRPVATTDDDGNRQLIWPSVVTYGPTSVLAQNSTAPGLADDADLPMRADNSPKIYLLLGTEPSRNWQSFTAGVMATIAENEITGIVLMGAMLADVPHTRPISVFVSSEHAGVRSSLGIERSGYEGPVGILSVLCAAAHSAGVPAVSIWASVPHYVHNAPSPKATLALIDKLEEIIDVVIPRGDLIDESAAWETGIDVLANEDDDMSSYIAGLEQARDTVDSPLASGEAIATEFEKYLRHRDVKGGAVAGGSSPGAPNLGGPSAAGPNPAGPNPAEPRDDSPGNRDAD